MKTVFNTGKVKIGLTYDKPNRIVMDRDALRLQRALICKDRQIDLDGIAIAISCLTVVALVLVSFWSR